MSKESPGTLQSTIVAAASMGIAVGFITILLEYRLKKGIRFGLILLGLGVCFLFLSILGKKRSHRPDMPADTAAETSSRKITEDFIQPVSFVAPGPPLTAQSLIGGTPGVRSSLDDAMRFVVYRLELLETGVKAIYSNHSIQEYGWLQLSALIIRQLPLATPWDGKLLFDILPSVPAGGSPRPLRLLSTTYVNYAALPQGQSASSRENIRRLGQYLAAQNSSIFIEPSSAGFFTGTTAPVRFQSIAQFIDYDSQYT